jgi:hypothetical protein
MILCSQNFQENLAIQMSLVKKVVVYCPCEFMNKFS